jgi:hypothetical protein
MHGTELDASGSNANCNSRGCRWPILLAAQLAQAEFATTRELGRRDRRQHRDATGRPASSTSGSRILVRRGEEHKRTVLERFRADGHDVVDVSEAQDGPGRPRRTSGAGPGSSMDAVQQFDHLGVGPVGYGGCRWAADSAFRSLPPSPRSARAWAGRWHWLRPPRVSPSRWSSCAVGRRAAAAGPQPGAVRRLGLSREDAPRQPRQARGPGIRAGQHAAVLRPAPRLKPAACSPRRAHQDLFLIGAPSPHLPGVAERVQAGRSAPARGRRQGECCLTRH